MANDQAESSSHAAQSAGASPADDGWEMPSITEHPEWATSNIDVVGVGFAALQNNQYLIARRMELHYRYIMKAVV